MPKTTTRISVLKHSLIRRLTQFNLERDNFVIFGSAPLLAHGIRRNIHDLDVVARGFIVGFIRTLAGSEDGGHKKLTGDRQVAADWSRECAPTGTQQPPQLFAGA